MDDRPMTFTEHLGELRTRLLRSVVALLATFFVAYGFHEEIFFTLARPVMAGLRAHGIYALQALQVTETITVYLQLSLVAAVILAAPYILWQVWAFIAPGLLPREKKYVLPVVGLVSSFFLLGVVFCYFVFLPMVVDFLVGFTVDTGTVSLIPTVEKTFSLSITFLLVFGLVFELPLLMFFLSLLGVVTFRTWKRVGRYFIVFAFILAAIFTPPDPLSQVLMAIPLCVLYYVGTAFGFVAGLLREGGRGAIARWLVAATFLLFAASIALASWVWTEGSGKARATAAVPADARMALRADPASAAGRSVLASLDAPTQGEAAVPEGVVLAAGPSGRSWVALGKDFPCDGGTRAPGGRCILQGAPGADTEPDPAFAGLARDSTPVVLVLLPPCVGRMLPDGVGAGTSVEADLVSPGNGFATLTVRFRGDEAGRATAARWAREARAGLAPGHPVPGLDGTPLGRTLAWSEGDADVDDTGNEVAVALTVPAPRAARMLAGLARDALERCQR